MPFNIEFGTGNLAMEKFIFYLVRDALYLTDFSRALAMTAVRLPHNNLMQQFIKFSQEALTAEQALHQNYIRRHATENILEHSPACFMYTNYILRMASQASVEEAVASLLPCFWVYREVGNSIAAICNRANNPYLEWINLYSSAEFDLSVQQVIAITNTLSLSAKASPIILNHVC